MLYKNFGSVVQLVRMPPCHGGGRGFESRPVRINGLLVLTRRPFLFMGYFVYILKNATDAELYKGFSENPYERLIYHNLGKSTFTSTKKSWEFIFLKEFPNKTEALKFERRIKKWNRRSLYKLIESSENSLQKE